MVLVKHEKKKFHNMYLSRNMLWKNIVHDLMTQKKVAWLCGALIHVINLKHHNIHIKILI